VWGGSTVAVGVGFASVLLYHLVNHVIGDPIEEEHWELEPPTSVSNLARQNRVGPLFVWIVFVVGSYAVENRNPGSTRGPSTQAIPRPSPSPLRHHPPSINLRVCRQSLAYLDLPGRVAPKLVERAAVRQYGRTHRGGTAKR